MNYEQKNALIAKISYVLGFMVFVFGMMFYFLDREPWQAIMAIVGIALMGFAAFADN